MSHVRHVLETLESRLLLDSHPVLDFGAEIEPNNHFTQANVIELVPDGWDCDLVCPLAEVTTDETTEPGDAEPTGVVGPTWWPGDRTLSGFVEGELESSLAVLCWSENAPMFCAVADIAPDADYFTFGVPSAGRLHIALDGPLATNGGWLTLFDANEKFLALDDDPADGIAINWPATDGGKFFVRVLGNDGYLNTPDNPTGYVLRVTAEPIRPDPHREQEPNDTLETANEIDLQPPFSWPCDFVCPLADSTGIAGIPTDPDTPDVTREANIELRPIRWPNDGTLHGFVVGELENATCPPDAVCIAVIQPGVDNFVFDVPAEQQLNLHLAGPLAQRGGVLTLLDSAGVILAMDQDGSDGLVIDWRTMNGGTFYAQVTGGGGPVELLSCNDTRLLATAICAAHATYRLNVTSVPLVNPIEGPDEQEPNDTIEQANEVELPRVGDAVCLAIGCPPAPLPGEYARHGVVHGIAGGPTHDADYFWFQALAGEQVSVGLGQLRSARVSDPTGLATGYSAPANIIDSLPDPQPLLFVTVFDSEGNEIARTEADTTNRIIFESGLGGVYFARVELQPDSPDAAVAEYALRLHARKFSNEGPDESEPNNTFDEADPIELVSLPTFAPGIELRGGDARGIAGGPSDDQDVFGFEVQAGEHVTVGITGFGRTLGECTPGFTSDGTACVHADERLPLFVYDRPIHVTVFDSELNEVGASDGSDGHPSVVSFNTDAAGQYFAVVSVSPDIDALVRYRLGVLARLSVEPEEVPPDDEPPLEITLRHGQTFRYTDSDGDAVQVVFQGRGGNAHIMFDGSDADGSDIVSVDIAGVRGGGNFRVRTNGSADVGSLEIDGLPGRARRPSSYGNVSIDGNLGSFHSSLNLRSLAVDGILGEVAAPGRQIGQVSAMVFDHAMADVGSIRSLHVDEEMSSAIFELFLTEEEQP